MHLGTDPEQEARSLYVEQSRLVERLQVQAGGPLVVWDVGLGAAANAMAAILAAEDLDAAGSMARPLLVVSFENDLDSLKLALDHPGWFKHLRHAAPRALLVGERWVNDTAMIEWHLLRGDFAARKLDAPTPD